MVRKQPKVDRTTAYLEQKDNQYREGPRSQYNQIGQEAGYKPAVATSCLSC
jgi:hypothetical protein